MYDALEDTPRSFQLKLVDALNSLGETMGVPPEEAFNKVLCKSDDGNEDVKKKLYNWWRAFFEVLGKCDRIPSDRVQEFDQKVDDLMAEIMRAGDAEATSEEEPVLESEEDEADPGYEQATKDDEDKMLADMEFAIQHIGEVANKVKAVVNFINPYCGTEVNESGDQPKFKVGDVVRVMGVSGMDFYGRDAPIGSIVKIEPPHPDVGVYEYLIKGRSGEFFAYEDELELVPERFTEEESSMKKKMNERGRIQNGDSEWVPMDDYIGMEFEESDNGEGFWKAMDDVDRLEQQGYWSGEFKVGDKVIWIDPEYPDEPSDGWRVVDAPEDDGVEDPDAIYVIVNDETGSEAEVYGHELRPSGLLKEDGNQAPANELKKGDDGWKEIGQPIGEATVVVDADTVWDVLELLDDDVANQNLTELINSHTRSEEEIMDAVENILGASGYSDNVPKAVLNGMFSSDNIHELIEELGLDVDAYMDRGEIQDANKPTSVELERSNDEIQDGEVKDGEKQVTQDGETKTLVAGEGETKKPVCEMTIEQEVDDPWKLSEMLWSQGKENLEELLRSELVGEEDIMMMLEDMGLRNLTNINDAFAFDFPSILDSLGLDAEAWSQNLEIKPKGGED